MGANPSALVRLMNEFLAAEKDAVNGGIYANKGGYHNTRNNHRRDRPGDYSIQAAADKRGPGDKAAAVDITFRTAQRSDFRIIDKYTSRLINAMKRRDKRLFYNGQAVVRECFGNADRDRQVEGWSLYRGYAVSSDSSHLWHLHISFHRQFVENWAACRGVLDVLLDRDDTDWFDMATKAELRDLLDAQTADVVGRVWGWDHVENVSSGKEWTLKSMLSHLEDEQDKLRVDVNALGAKLDRVLNGLHVLMSQHEGQTGRLEGILAEVKDEEGTK